MRHTRGIYYMKIKINKTALILLFGILVPTINGSDRGLYPYTRINPFDSDTPDPNELTIRRRQPVTPWQEQRQRQPPQVLPAREETKRASTSTSPTIGQGRTRAQPERAQTIEETQNFKDRIKQIIIDMLSESEITPNGRNHRTMLAQVDQLKFLKDFIEKNLGYVANEKRLNAGKYKDHSVAQAFELCVKDNIKNCFFALNSLLGDIDNKLRTRQKKILEWVNFNPFISKFGMLEPYQIGKTTGNANATHANYREVVGEELYQHYYEEMHMINNRIETIKKLFTVTETPIETRKKEYGRNAEDLTQKISKLKEQVTNTDKSFNSFWGKMVAEVKTKNTQTRTALPQQTQLELAPWDDDLIHDLKTPINNCLMQLKENLQKIATKINKLVDAKLTASERNILTNYKNGMLKIAELKAIRDATLYENTVPKYISSTESPNKAQAKRRWEAEAAKFNYLTGILKELKFKKGLLKSTEDRKVLEYINFQGDNASLDQEMADVTEQIRSSRDAVQHLSDWYRRIK
jgi:hypothetical protein